MKKLTKFQSAERDRLIADLTVKAADAATQWAAFETAHAALADAIATYNGVVLEAAIFRDEIVSEMGDYQSERSERWREGEAGDVYQTWLEDWQNAELDAIEIPDLSNEPEFSHIDVLDVLPEELG